MSAKNNTKCRKSTLQTLYMILHTQNYKNRTFKQEYSRLNKNKQT